MSDSTLSAMTDSRGALVRAGDTVHLHKEGHPRRQVTLTGLELAAEQDGAGARALARYEMDGQTCTARSHQITLGEPDEDLVGAMGIADPSSIPWSKGSGDVYAGLPPLGTRD